MFHSLEEKQNIPDKKFGDEPICERTILGSLLHRFNKGGKSYGLICKPLGVLSHRP